ncbi:HmuY family protein [Aquimarina sediminis]|uniref:HmuY family protein n=1 Tax=Aquimarina sediminis TaxID=2070536 RepID=UPI000CA0580E|nr:HmuY family protein [Aquimarina sediminis]
MKTNLIFIKALLLLFIVSGCSSDDDTTIQEFAVAFENPSVSFSTTDENKEVKIVFSSKAPQAGNVTVNYTVENAVYGADADFTTVPSGETGSITVAFKQGDSDVSFTINKLKNPIEGVTQSVSFSLAKVSVLNSIMSGNTNLAVSFTESAALGGIISPKVGGANEPNQVYVDLSAQSQVDVLRDSWDLGFYGGSEFRVSINGSIFMGAAQLDATDINTVKEADVTAIKDLIKTSAPNTAQYFDGPTGEITKTVIAEVSETDAENKVYLLKLGFEVSTKAAEVGGVELSGDLRGWKKIRILRSGDDYVLQHADIAATTFEEIKISKDSDYNFRFFSFNTKNIVDVEPKKEKWDLNFTVFTNILDFGGGNLGGYGYSDYVVTNLKGGANSYMVMTADFTYEDFTLANVNNANFIVDQRGIGSNWRSVFTGSVKDDRFFVVKDTDGNLYKIRFNALTDDSGVRGNPKFEYTLLQ